MEYGKHKWETNYEESVRKEWGESENKSEERVKCMNELLVVIVNELLMGIVNELLIEVWVVDWHCEQAVDWKRALVETMNELLDEVVNELLAKTNMNEKLIEIEHESLVGTVGTKWDQRV